MMILHVAYGIPKYSTPLQNGPRHEQIPRLLAKLHALKRWKALDARYPKAAKVGVLATPAMLPWDKLPWLHPVDRDLNRTQYIQIARHVNNSTRSCSISHVILTKGMKLLFGIIMFLFLVANSFQQYVLVSFFQWVNPWTSLDIF